MKRNSRVSRLGVCVYARNGNGTWGRVVVVVVVAVLLLLSLFGRYQQHPRGTSDLRADGQVEKAERDQIILPLGNRSAHTRFESDEWYWWNNLEGPSLSQRFASLDCDATSQHSSPMANPFQDEEANRAFGRNIPRYTRENSPQSFLCSTIRWKRCKILDPSRAHYKIATCPPLFPRTRLPIHSLTGAGQSIPSFFLLYQGPFRTFSEPGQNAVTWG